MNRLWMSALVGVLSVAPACKKSAEREAVGVYQLDKASTLKLIEKVKAEGTSEEKMAAGFVEGAIRSMESTLELKEGGKVARTDKVLGVEATHEGTWQAGEEGFEVTLKGETTLCKPIDGALHCTHNDMPLVYAGQ